MILTALVLAKALTTEAPVAMPPMDALKAAQSKVNFEVYVPDSTARGYKLTEVEVVPVQGRQVLHMKFVNAKVMNSFDLFEAAGNEKTEAGTDLKSILSSNTFAVSAGEDDTLVSIKKGKTNIMMAGSLITTPSAKQMLEHAALMQK